MASLLSDGVEFGKRIAAARGYRREQRPAFAKRIGTSDTTLLRWEDGEFSSNYRTAEQRRQLARLVVSASGCPPEWFELEEPAPDRLDELEEQVSRLGESLRRLASLALEADEEAEFRRYLTSGRRSEEPGPEEESG